MLNAFKKSSKSGSCKEYYEQNFVKDRGEELLEKEKSTG